MSAPATTNKPLYTGQLVERFFKKLDERREYLKRSYNAKSGKRITIRGIARLSGTPYDTVRNHLDRRNRAMGFQELDKYLYATGISVLDLLYPSELLSFIKSLDATDRQSFNEVLYAQTVANINKLVDKSAE